MIHRVAIIGSGPSAMYTAKYLLEKDIHVDLFERLCLPFGLARYGVACDHQEAKACCTQFLNIIKDSRLRFYGNTELGSHIKLQDLESRYSAVVVSTGSSSERRLGITGETSAGVFSSRDIVNWYNGYPFAKKAEISDILRTTTKRVIIIGQGNVSIDIARILMKDRDELAKSDISLSALSTLRNLHADSVAIIGRRGHIQSSFTIKELRELSKLDGVTVRADPDEISKGLNPASLIEVQNSRPKKRIGELLASFGVVKERSAESTVDMCLRFFLQPTKILSSAGHLTGVEFEKTNLIGESGSQQLVGTGQLETIPCDLLVTSLGYMNSPIEGLPFDSKLNLIPSSKGRITNTLDLGRAAPYYVTGWLKRGPRGIIGTNIPDAKETVDSLVEDLTAGKLPKVINDDWLPHDKIVDKDGFLRIEEREVALGNISHPPRPRVKIEDFDELFRIATTTKQ